ncbi:hypothetical protein QM042_02180 [Escherichia coli]|uniref:hypothetical protein n=1 Tax=Escherichia coli TaxID=562 RepID=UPI003985781B
MEESFAAKMQDATGTASEDMMGLFDTNYYQMQQMNQQMQMAQLNQQLQQTGQSFQKAGQQMLQQSQSYTAPQVQSYGSSGSTTYTQVGNNIIGSDGTSCTYVGQSFIWALTKGKWDFIGTQNRPHVSYPTNSYQHVVPLAGKRRTGQA